MRPPPPLRYLSEGEIAIIDKKIIDLLKKDAIKVCSHTPGEFVSNIFTIPKKSGGNSPVIDMRVSSELVKYIPFRMEDVSLLKSVVKQRDFMTKLDIRDAYITVPMNKKIKNLFLLHLKGCTLSIHLPLFRFLFFRQNFHQSNEASDCISKSHGDQFINFSRQHIDHGKLSGACNATHRLGNPGLNLLGMCDKLPEVHSHPFKGFAIPSL